VLLRLKTMPIWFLAHGMFVFPEIHGCYIINWLAFETKGKGSQIKKNDLNCH